MSDHETQPAAKPATMKTKEVMAALKMGRTALQGAVDRRDIPTCWAHKPGKSWPRIARFPRAAIERIAAEGVGGGK